MKILLCFLLSFSVYSFDLIIEPGVGFQHQGDLFFNDYNNKVDITDDSYVSAPIKNHISILTLDLGAKYNGISFGFRGEWSGPDFIANGLWSLFSVEDEEIGRSHRGKKFFVGYDIYSNYKIELTYGTKSEMQDGGLYASYDHSFGFGLSHKVTDLLNLNFNYGKLISSSNRQSNADEVSLRFSYPLSFALIDK